MKCYFICCDKILQCITLSDIPEMDDTIEFEGEQYVITSKYYQEDFVRLHMRRITLN